MSFVLMSTLTFSVNHTEKEHKEKGDFKSFNLLLSLLNVKLGRLIKLI